MQTPDFSQYEPVRKPEAVAVLTPTDAIGGIAPTDTPAAPVVPALSPDARLVAAIPAPTLRFVGGRMRERTFKLDFPIECNGRIYDAITLRRPTSAEVGAYFERVAAAAAFDPDGQTVLPVFVDEAGEPIPEAVIGFLDGEDDERISGAVADFLPPRLRRFQEALQPGSPPSAGVNTEPTSST